MTTRTSRRTTMAPQRSGEHDALPGIEPEDRPHRTDRRKATLVVSTVVAGIAGATALVALTFSGDDAAPSVPNAPSIVNQLPSGVDGSDARLYNRSREQGGSQGTGESGTDGSTTVENGTDGSDTRLHNRAKEQGRIYDRAQVVRPTPAPAEPPQGDPGGTRPSDTLPPG